MTEAIEERVRAEEALARQCEAEDHVSAVADALQEHVNRNSFGQRIAAALRGEQQK